MKCGIHISYTFFYFIGIKYLLVACVLRNENNRRNNYVYFVISNLNKVNIIIKSAESYLIIFRYIKTTSFCLFK